jgi:O-antigen ligase
MLLGFLVVDSPRRAALFAAAVAAIGILFCLRAVSALVLLCGAVVLTSPFADILGRLHLGRFTADAALTGIYAVLGLVFLHPLGAVGLRLRSGAITAFAGLLTYGLVSLLWGGVHTQSIQNLLVLAVFATALHAAASAVAQRRRSICLISRLFDVVSLMALGFYGASLLIGGLGSGAVIGGRSFGLLAILIVAWQAAGWRYDHAWSMHLTALTILFVILSLSRTAFAVSLIVVAASWLSVHSFRGWFRLTLTLVVVGSIAYFAVGHVGALHQRFVSGDVQTLPGDVSVNLEGRSQLWSATWRSFQTSPYFGHGAGNTNSLISRDTGGTTGEAHDDYLRLLNDYGLLGFFLWVCGYFLLLRGAWRAWQARGEPRLRQSGTDPRSDPLDRRLQTAAFTGQLGVGLAMATDNPLEYLHVMGPLAVLAGVALGARSLAQSRSDVGNAEAGPA